MITTFQLIVFVTYVGYLLHKFNGPIHSISDSWYQLPQKEKLLFSLFCWSLGGAMLFQGSGDKIYFFLSGMGLCFVGGMVAFRQNIGSTDKIHYLGALIGIVCALIGIGIEGGTWLPAIVWILSAVVMKLLKIKHFIWWVEIAAFATIVTGLYFL